MLLEECTREELIKVLIKGSSVLASERNLVRFPECSEMFERCSTVWSRCYYATILKILSRQLLGSKLVHRPDLATVNEPN